MFKTVLRLKRYVLISSPSGLRLSNVARDRLALFLAIRKLDPTPPLRNERRQLKPRLSGATPRMENRADRSRRLTDVVQQLGERIAQRQDRPVSLLRHELEGVFAMNITRAGRRLLLKDRLTGLPAQFGSIRSSRRLHRAANSKKHAPP